MKRLARATYAALLASVLGWWVAAACAAPNPSGSGDSHHAWVLFYTGMASLLVGVFLAVMVEEKS